MACELTSSAPRSSETITEGGKAEPSMTSAQLFRASGLPNVENLGHRTLWFVRTKGPRAVLRAAQGCTAPLVAWLGCFVSTVVKSPGPAACSPVLPEGKDMPPTLFLLRATILVRKHAAHGRKKLVARSWRVNQREGHPSTTLWLTASPATKHVSPCDSLAC